MSTASYQYPNITISTQMKQTTFVCSAERLNPGPHAYSATTTKYTQPLNF